MPLLESGDSSDVEVVSGPQRSVAELVDIADDDSDAGVADGDSDAWEEVIDGNGVSDVSGGSSDVHNEVVDTSDVEVVGGIDAEPLSVATVRQEYSKPTELRFAALASTPLSPPPSPPPPTWREYISRTTGLAFCVNAATRETVYAKPAELRGPTSAALAPTPTPAPPPMPRGRLRWPRATPTSLPAPVPTPPRGFGTQARFIDGEHVTIRNSFDRWDWRGFEARITSVPLDPSTGEYGAKLLSSRNHRRDTGSLKGLSFEISETHLSRLGRGLGGVVAPTPAPALAFAPRPDHQPNVPAWLR